MTPVDTTNAHLPERCAEVLQWHRTGILKGEYLQLMADQLRGPLQGNLQVAEAKTGVEAMQFVVAHFGAAAANDPGAGGVMISPVLAQCIERAWAQSLGDAAGMHPGEALEAARNGMRFAASILVPGLEFNRLRRSVMASDAANEVLQ